MYDYARTTTAADKPEAPKKLVALLKRTVSGTKPEYKHLPGTETPHLFTYPANLKFSIMKPDIQTLLRQGLMRMQTNDINNITLYFADKSEET
jgi:hypothetical protein